VCVCVCVQSRDRALKRRIHKVDRVLRKGRHRVHEIKPRKPSDARVAPHYRRMHEKNRTYRETALVVTPEPEMDPPRDVFLGDARVSLMLANVAQAAQW
jgi:hypothetical protein